MHEPRLRLRSRVPQRGLHMDDGIPWRLWRLGIQAPAQSELMPASPLAGQVIQQYGPLLRGACEVQTQTQQQPYCRSPRGPGAGELLRPASPRQAAPYLPELRRSPCHRDFQFPLATHGLASQRTAEREAARPDQRPGHCTERWGCPRLFLEEKTNPRASARATLLQLPVCTRRSPSLSRSPDRTPTRHSRAAGPANRPGQPGQEIRQARGREYSRSEVYRGPHAPQLTPRTRSETGPCRSRRSVGPGLVPSCRTDRLT
jgi:hypothetical protein